MKFRCKPGDLAVVVHDIPECAGNIGGIVRIRGPVEYNARYRKWCWLIKPAAKGLWMVDLVDSIQSMNIRWKDQIEHPDDWLEPFPPDLLDWQAEQGQQALDGWLLTLRAELDEIRRHSKVAVEQ